MRAGLAVIAAAVFLLVSFSDGQTSSTTAELAARPLRPDQLAIYADFLSQYDEGGQISNLPGLQPVTVLFDLDRLLGRDEVSVRAGMTEWSEDRSWGRAAVCTGVAWIAGRGDGGCWVVENGLREECGKAKARS